LRRKSKTNPNLSPISLSAAFFLWQREKGIARSERYFIIDLSVKRNILNQSGKRSQIVKYINKVYMDNRIWIYPKGFYIII